MKHSNISIFVPHVGCPHMCAFCNQRTISGKSEIPTGNDVREICKKALDEVSDKKNCEIAFFGGSFTAIEKSYMISLLEAAREFVGETGFKGIRCSTRPDCISPEILDLLKSYNVTAIELGAQSMSDKVLAANERGHTASDVVNAACLIKEYGFELGLQMMVGLYKSDEQDEFETVDRIISIAPDTVRIYPTVILNGTKLAELYKSGEYKTFDFDRVVEMCSLFLEKFEKQGIRVIKCGLHASELVEKDIVGGFYHPAFKELCRSEIFLRKINQILSDNDIRGGEVTFVTSPSSVSAAIGHKRSNYDKLLRKGIRMKIIPDKEIGKNDIMLKG